MKRIDRRRVKTITEQATRNALKKQQLNEWGRVGSLIGKAATGLWNGGKNFFRGAGPGLGGRMGRSLGFGAKNAMKDYNRSLTNLGRYEKGAMAASDRAGQIGVLSQINPGLRPWANKAYMQADKWNAALNNARLQTDINRQFAMQLAKNSARAKGLGAGLLGGGILGASIAGAGGGGGTTPQPSGMPGETTNPYAGSYSGGYADPYAGYYSGGYTDPYAAYYSGYADPYAGYYSGGYTDPYAAYYSGGYSTPSTGGGSSSNPQDLAALMMLANQNGSGGNSGGMDLATMMALSGGNMDPAMMMALSGGNMDPNDIWGLGGYA